ncbi:hypothetical protein [Deinococcus sp. 6GRE01]|uniref:hypothetical protein n=1 Tax=Deinococcus sp. 6GRE01 TaxID=2745873 RepID=UPI001E4E2C83|nr:hypothetical protein [Deinococcus sp. 6GRE01]MCD0155954.1 hypothetical protein [Deinococcus sp. 6GRE01]
MPRRLTAMIDAANRWLEHLLPEPAPDACGTCAGHGVLNVWDLDWPPCVCPTCRGTGRQRPTPCRVCGTERHQPGCPVGRKVAA